MLLYRPSYYQQGDDRNLDNLAILDVAKYRHGSTGRVRMSFQREFTRFEDRNEEDDEFNEQE